MADHTYVKISTNNSLHNRIGVWYGSQTGNAECIAQRIHGECERRGWNSYCCCLNDFNNVGIWLIMVINSQAPIFFESLRITVIVCSTTGNGDPPENCSKYWRWLKQRSLKKDLLKPLCFSVLALGDTNYNNFCAVGKNIDRRLGDVGGVRFYPLGCADDAVGLDAVVEPWIHGLWIQLEELVSHRSSRTSSMDEAESKLENPSSIPHSVSEPLHETSPIMTLDEVYNYLRITDKIAEVDLNASPPLADIPNLRNIEPSKCQIGPSTSLSRRRSSTREPDSVHPFQARVLTQHWLCQSSDKKVMSMELNIFGSGIVYQPGDCVGVKGQNRSCDVNAVSAVLLRSQNISLSDSIEFSSSDFPSPLSIQSLLVEYLDLTTPLRKASIRQLACRCIGDGSEFDANRMLWLASKNPRSSLLYKSFVEDQRLTVGEFLSVFRTCHPSIEILLSILPPLPPRLYSITSTPLTKPTSVTVAYSVINYEVGESLDHKFIRNGLCTHWLSTMQSASLVSKQSFVPIFHRASHDFHLPSNSSFPVIMVGPGTGVAPFIGFIQHRRQYRKIIQESRNDVSCGVWRGEEDICVVDDDERTEPEYGSMILYFGCRSESDDWIFKDDMNQFVADGSLTQLRVAFSRQESSKRVYVQDLMLEDGQMICNLIMNKGAYVFVCGDGNDMARDVFACFRRIIIQYSTIGISGAEEYLTEMKKRSRYVQDVWS